MGNLGNGDAAAGLDTVGILSYSSISMSEDVHGIVMGRNRRSRWRTGVFKLDLYIKDSDDLSLAL